jgi:hypothetical protein
MANFTVNEKAEQTTVAADDSFLMQTAAGVTKRAKAGAGLRGAIIKPGFYDLLPIWTYFTGVSAPVHTTIIGNRKAPAFAGSGAIEQLYNEYHTGHDVDLLMTEYEVHLHWEHNTAAPTGNAKFNIDYCVAARDGSYSAEVTNSVIITPTAGNIYKNNVTAIQPLTAQVALFNKPDTNISMRVWRDSADAADTFTGNIFYHTCDFHLATDNKSTTSRDFGTGWVKA